MTREELRDIVILNTGRSDKASLINSAFNLGLKDISRYNTFRAMISESDLTITASSSSVALPSRTYLIESATLINGVSSFPFELRTKDFFRSRFPYVEALASSTPSIGYHEGDNLYFAPIADKEYTLRITVAKMLEEWDNDNDEAEVDFIDDALVAYATAYVFRSTQQYKDASAWMEEYARGLAAAVSADRKLGGVEIKAQEFVRAGQLENPSRLVAEDPFAGLRRR